MFTFLPIGGIYIPAGGPTTSPSFIGVGTANDSTAATLTPAYPTNASGDLFICQIVGYGMTFNTPSGWTLQKLQSDTDPFGTVLYNYVFTRDTRATGSDSGTVSFTVSSGALLASARIYNFRNVATSSFIESITSVAGTSASTIAGPSVASTGNHRLACAFYAGYVSIAANTGSSGGTWTEATQYDSSSTLFIEVQKCDLVSTGTISGGTSAVSSVGGRYSNCAAFALVGI